MAATCSCRCGGRVTLGSGCSMGTSSCELPGKMRVVCNGLAAFASQLTHSATDTQPVLPRWPIPPRGCSSAVWRRGAKRLSGCVS